MGSENPSGADNQQESFSPRLELDPQLGRRLRRRRRLLLDIGTPVRNAGRLGWQVQPVFSRLPAASYRRCSKHSSGVRVRHDHREQPHNDHREQLWSLLCRSVASTSSTSWCRSSKRYPLRTVEAVRLRALRADRADRCTEASTYSRRVRTTPRNRLRHELRRQAAQQQSREIFLESSETIRQPLGSNTSASCEDTVRASWRHGESGRNDLTTQQQPAVCGVTTMPKVAKFLVG